jgi:hypothetical protein
MKFRENPYSERANLFPADRRLDGQMNLAVFIVILRARLTTEQGIFRHKGVWHITDMLERQAPFFCRIVGYRSGCCVMLRCTVG